MNSDIIEIKELFRPDEVARILGISIRTVRRWVKEGRLDGKKFSRKCLRITRKSILALKTSEDLVTIDTNRYK
jgi:excisionase family DNA binding protein